MTIADIETDYQPEQLEQMWVHLVDGNPMTVTGTHRRRDGTEFPVEVRISQFESEGHHLVLALARDVTENRRTEEALRQTNETLEALIQASPLAIAPTTPTGV